MALRPADPTVLPTGAGSPQNRGVPAVPFSDLTDVFPPEEIRDMMARSEQLNLQGDDLNAFYRARLSKKTHELEMVQAEARDNPSFQQRAVEEQLPPESRADLSTEKATFGQAWDERMSPLFGGLGGSMTTEGEFKDVQAANPGARVKPVSMPTGTGQKTLFMVEQPDKSWQPWNKPGASPADFGNVVGDMFTLSGLGSFVPLLGPAARARVMARAGVSALGAGAGGAADAVLDPNSEKNFGLIMARAGSGAVSSAAGELLIGNVINLANFVSGRGAMSDASHAAFARAQTAQDIAGAPLLPGQISPNSMAAMWRSRFSRFSPALQEQILQQKILLGAPVKDAIEQFRNLDGVDQALLGTGISTDTLSAMEADFSASLQAKARNQLHANSTDSLSRAGRNVQDSLLGLNKDSASYRQMHQQLLARLDDNMLNIAQDSPQFSLDLRQPVRMAKEELAAFDVLQNQPNRVATNLEAGTETLGAGVGQVLRGHHDDLQFVLKTLNSLADPHVLNRATYRIRVGKSGELEPDVMQVDGEGNLRVPYKEVPDTQNQWTAGTEGRQQVGTLGNKGQAHSPKEGPVIGTYDVDGVTLIRMLRGKLRGFFDNPLVPANSHDKAVARRLYGQLGDSMEDTAGGAPAEFTRSVQQFNRSASRYMDTTDRLQTARLATEKDGEGLVSMFTGGGMGFETLFTLKNALRHTDNAKATAAWTGYKDAASRDLIQNPHKIEAMGHMDPKALNLMYSPEEQTALKVYQTSMKELQSAGFEPIARKAIGARGRALSLFNELPDTRFPDLWRNLPDTEKNVMRTAVIEDLLHRSSSAQGGVGAVPDPAALERNIGELMRGDLGNRAKEVLPKETLKMLQDRQTLAAFYKEVMPRGQMATSMAAQDVAGAPIHAFEAGLAKGGMVGRMVNALLPVRLNIMLAESLAKENGHMFRLLSPRLKGPYNSAKLNAMAVWAASGLDGDRKAGEAEFDRYLSDQGARAQKRALR